MLWEGVWSCEQDGYRGTYSGLLLADWVGVIVIGNDLQLGDGVSPSGSLDNVKDGPAL